MWKINREEGLSWKLTGNRDAEPPFAPLSKAPTGASHCKVLPILNTMKLYLKQCINIRSSTYLHAILYLAESYHHFKKQLLKVVFGKTLMFWLGIPFGLAEFPLFRHCLSSSTFWHCLLLFSRFTLTQAVGQNWEKRCFHD